MQNSTEDLKGLLISIQLSLNSMHQAVKAALAKHPFLSSKCFPQEYLASIIPIPTGFEYSSKRPIGKQCVMISMLHQDTHPVLIIPLYRQGMLNAVFDCYEMIAWESGLDEIIESEEIKTADGLIAKVIQKSCNNIQRSAAILNRACCKADL